MRDLEAELDLASIDKVDVRNELRRFTMLWEAGADLQNFGPYLNLCMYAKTCDRPAVSFCHAPVKPKKHSVALTPLNGVLLVYIYIYIKRTQRSTCFLKL